MVPILLYAAFAALFTGSGAVVSKNNYDNNYASLTVRHENRELTPTAVATWVKENVGGVNLYENDIVKGWFAEERDCKNYIYQIKSNFGLLGPLGTEGRLYAVGYQINCRGNNICECK
jgi:hypothetical protein